MPQHTNGTSSHPVNQIPRGYAISFWRKDLVIFFYQIEFWWGGGIHITLQNLFTWSCLTISGLLPLRICTQHALQRIEDWLLKPSVSHDGSYPHPSNLTCIANSFGQSRRWHVPSNGISVVYAIVGAPVQLPDQPNDWQQLCSKGSLLLVFATQLQ